MIKVDMKQKRYLLMTFLGCCLLSACTQRLIESEHLAMWPKQLPIAVSNNAVAYVSVDGKEQFYSFNGLLSGKTYQDITNRAFVWKKGQWAHLHVPDTQLPVLASTAVTVDQHVYLIGGYTVEADHSEKSVPNVWKINPRTHEWIAMSAMPTPVDDTVALVYKNRYIYLMSGWHDVDNVDLVQMFDTVENTWHQATPFPLPPVFGHAGGIIGNSMLICDGVKVVKANNKKQFLPSPACAVGEINPDDLLQIKWQVIEHHSGTAYYRMAAASDDLGDMYFMGGSDNPYNYDGIGYNEQPSKPSDLIRKYNMKTDQWSVVDGGLPASMDHRALLKTPNGFAILGGMKEGQEVINRITYYKYKK